MWFACLMLYTWCLQVGFGTNRSVHCYFVLWRNNSTESHSRMETGSMHQSFSFKALTLEWFVYIYGDGVLFHPLALIFSVNSIREPFFKFKTATEMDSRAAALEHIFPWGSAWSWQTSCLDRNSSKMLNSSPCPECSTFDFPAHHCLLNVKNYSIFLTSIWSVRSFLLL